MLEVDDFDDYVTSTNDPDDNINHDDIIQDNMNMWDSTNTGEFIFDVQANDEFEKKGVCKDVTISGHVILNQCGCLLTRKRHMIKGSRKQNFFIQKLCAKSVGGSVP